MPRDRYMEKKSRSSLMKFGLVGGIESDTDPARVQVLDSNNVFPSPNGSEAGPRPGCEIRKRYRVTTSPVGRKAIVIETAPPDVGLGNLIMVINTRNGRNAIEAGAFVRDRTQLPLQSQTALVSIQANMTIAGPGLIEITAERAGDLSIYSTVLVRTADGTAIGGVDYDIISGEQLSFEAGSTGPAVNIFNPVGTAPGTFFFVELYSPSEGTLIRSGTMVVNIV